MNQNNLVYGKDFRFYRWRGGLVRIKIYLDRIGFFTQNLFMHSGLINRITINPDICHGKPSIRNQRYTVELVLDLLSSGMTQAEIINDYPNIEREDILACLEFASQLIKVKSIYKASA